MAPDSLDPSNRPASADEGLNPARRGLLLGAAAALSSAPGFAQTIARALAVPAQRLSGGLGDIEHVVFLMQENRSFDHYFGSLAGVRGFSDPRAVPLPSGKPVWQQPGGTADVVPYHFDVRNTNALRVGLDHSWKGSEAAWKDWNAWVPKKGARCMGYFNRQDLPFYYALADAFTVCDAYHCALFGPTDPNRFYALSGHSGGVVTGIGDSRLYNVNGGIYNADIANDNSAATGISWSSYAEQLDGLGVSWKVYQEWDNYGDNYLQYFRRYRVDASGAKLTPASPLYQRARAMAPGSGPGVAITAGIAAGLAVGVVVGLCNGIAVAVFGITPFMVTLAMASIVGGVALSLTNGIPIYGLPEAFVAGLGRTLWLGMPPTVWAAAIVVLLVWIVQKYTALGTRIYAVGGSPQASRVSGIDVRFHLVLAYVGCALAASLASLLLTAQIGSGQGSVGDTLALQSIGAAVIAGVSLHGGVGRVQWVALGSLFLLLLNNAMDLLRVDSKAQAIVMGLLIVLVVALDEFKKRRKIDGH